MPRCSVILNEKYPPFAKGGGAQRRSLCVRHRKPATQPPEGSTATVVSPSFPFGKGDFQENYR